MDTALVEQLLDPKSPINIDSLLDAISALVHDCKIPNIRNKSIEKFMARYQRIVEQVSSMRLKGSDFKMLKVIGRGAFGEVQLVRHTQTKNVYAMKLLNKDHMLKRSESAFFWEERDIMAHANSDWIVKLHYAFQDPKFLYLVMEYMPGGDLVNLLAKYDVSEKWTRFYAAELVEALSCLHGMGYIHRDVKPDNMLITRSGHVKLADFGTCVKMSTNGVVKSSTAVGTPDYIAPEVLQNQGSEAEFGVEVDWWALGVVIFEMIYGDTPFYAEALINHYDNIKNHEKTLKFPDEPALSSNGKDIIKRLLSRADIRLGRNGPNDLRSHPFFKNSEWSFATLKSASPPVVPELKGDDDTTNFDIIEARQDNNSAFQLPKNFNGNQLSFIGFTYTNEMSPMQILAAAEKIKGNVGVRQSRASTIASGDVPQNEGDAQIQRNLEMKLEEMKSEVLDYKRRLNMANDDASRTECKARELEAERDRYSTKQRDMERELKEAQESISEREERVRRTEQELRLQRDSTFSMESKVTKYQETETQLQARMREMHKELAEEKENVARTTSTISELQRENSKLMGMISERTRDREELAGQLKKVLDENKENGTQQQNLMQQSEAETEKKIERLRKDAEKLRLELDQEANLRNNEKRQLDAMSRRLGILVGNERFLEQENERLKSEIGQVETMNERLHRENTHLEIKIDDMKQSQMEYENLIQLYRNEIKTSQEERQESDPHLQYEVDQLRKLLESEKLVRHLVEVNLTDIQTKKLLLQEECTRHQKELEQKEEQINFLADKTQELEQALGQAASQESTGNSEDVDGENLMLRKKLEQTQLEKKSLIRKLEEIMHRKMFDPKSKISKNDLKIKDVKLRGLEGENRDLKRDLDLKAEELRALHDDIGYQNQENERLSDDLERTKEEVLELRELLRRRTADDSRSLDSREEPISTITLNSPYEGWVAIKADKRMSGKKGNNWITLLARLDAATFNLYLEQAAGLTALYKCMDISKIVLVRNVTAADIRADEEQLVRIFQIKYDDESSTSGPPSRHASSSDLSLALAQELCRGHDFRELTFHMPTTCDYCSRKLNCAFSPPPAFECKKCHYKMHKNHIHEGNFNIVPCKMKSVAREITLMAQSREDCTHWIKRIRKMVPERKANSSVSRASSRVRSYAT